MSSSPIQNEEVFQFVMVRPPEPASEPEEDSSNLGGYTRKGPNTELIDQLANAVESGGRKDAEKVAKEFLKTVSDGSGPEAELQTKMRKLTRLYSAVYEKSASITTSRVEKAISRVFGDSPDEVYRTETFSKLSDHVWDRLYALMASGKNKPTERERLVRSIRALNLIELLAQTSEDVKTEDLMRVGELMPVLPEPVFPLPVPPIPNKGPGGDDKQERAADFYRKKKEDLVTELIDLYKSRENLIAAHKTVLGEEADAPPQSQPNANSGDSEGESSSVSKFEMPSSGEAPSSERQEKVFVRRSGLPEFWKVSDSLLTKMDEKARSTLKNSDITLENRPTDEVVESINSKLRDLTTRLYRYGGEREVVKLGNTLTAKSGPRSRKLDELASMIVGVPGLFSVEDDPSYFLDLNMGVVPEVIPGLDGVLEQAESRAVRVLGIGELNRMEQELLGYEMSEIAEITNVMGSERKKRVHRTLERSEETILTETEKTVTEETDLRRTERFEMSREAEKTVKSKSSVEAGVKVTAKYGPVKMEANAGYSSHNAKSRSKKRSTKYAQEVSEKSLRRIKKRTLERRKSRTIKETEETNTHEFDNTDGDHLSGIYRWVDKKYRGQVKSYGRRLMFEFIVPEPAAFFRYMQKNKQVEGVDIEKPPPIDSLTPNDITVWNYQKIAQKYQVEGLSPPPKRFQYVGTTLKSKDRKDLQPKTSSKVKVPNGYKAVDASVQGSILPQKLDDVELLIHVGENTISLTENIRIIGKNILAENTNDIHVQMGGLTGNIPIVAHPHHLQEYGVSTIIRCERTDEKLEKWKQSTYDKILKTYKAQKSRYEQEVEQAKANQETGISGNNPKRNREIEKEEIKKSCIALLRRQQYATPDAFDPAAGQDRPIIDFAKADASANRIQFFEQAFEWEQMAYVFYPYFWASPDEWQEMYPIEASDPQFRKFLRAGAARVVVPVEPDYESAALHYRETGEIWEGRDVPALDDELYVSITEELKEQKTGPSGGTPVGEPFEYTVPTQLVKLQQSNELPEPGE